MSACDVKSRYPNNEFGMVGDWAKRARLDATSMGKREMERENKRRSPDRLVWIMKRVTQLGQRSWHGAAKGDGISVCRCTEMAPPHFCFERGAKRRAVCSASSASPLQVCRSGIPGRLWSPAA